MSLRETIGISRREFRAQSLSVANNAIWQPEQTEQDFLKAQFVLSEARFDLREEERECARRAESLRQAERVRAEMAGRAYQSSQHVKSELPGATRATCKVEPHACSGFGVKPEVPSCSYHLCSGAKAEV